MVRYKIKVIEAHNGTMQYSPMLVNVKTFMFIPYGARKKYINMSVLGNFDLYEYVYQCFDTRDEAINVIEKYIEYTMTLPKSIKYEDYKNG